MSELIDVSCRGCGCLNCSRDSDNYPGGIRPSHCPHCPPEPCEECGGINDWARALRDDGGLCACWIDLRDMPLADIKALFAEHDDELSLDVEVGIRPPGAQS